MESLRKSFKASLKASWIQVGAAASVLSLLACQSNPMPELGQMTSQKPVTKPVDKPWGIDCPDQLEFIEGQEGQFQVTGWVPAPGSPVLAIEDLPAGASFSAADQKLSWNPGFADGNNPRNPSLGYRDYPVRVVLFSSDEPRATITKSVLLVVHDTPRPVELTFSHADFKLTEGKEFTTDVTIKSSDFPVGPFELFANGLPSSAVISRSETDPSRYTVSYTPSMTDVLYTDAGWSGPTEKEFPISFVAFDPSGNKTVTDVIWNIRDVRKKAEFSAPDSVIQGLDVNFLVTAEDPNGESAPTVTVITPGFGEVNLDESEDGLVTRMGVRWNKIPEDKIGKNFKLKFKACVHDTRVQDLCSNHEVSVLFATSVMMAPEIDRTKWPLGQIKYVRKGDEIRIGVPVTDGNWPKLSTTVTIDPPALRGQITWNNGNLIIKANEAGVKQFNLIATNTMGRQDTESFNVELLPSTWSSTLILGDSLKDPEIQSTLRFFKNAQVLNPAMQVLDDRVLALRSTLVVGTSALSDSTQMEAIDHAVGLVKDVFIHSALVERLVQFGGELSRQMGKVNLELQGRVSSVTSQQNPALDSLPLVTGENSGLASSANKMVLDGTLTSESRDPMTFKFKSSAGCKSLLDLEYKAVPSLPAYRLSVATSCSLGGGAKLIIAGFEWGDIQAKSSLDSGLAADWLDDIL